MTVSEKYMSRCLELAKNGRGNVAPNPMVGAVIVRNDRIIGEGYHCCYGEAHAEVNAIASVDDEQLLRDATMYVNLEPCSHYGKTPPCAELIIQKGIPRVVIAGPDPFPEVAGRGVKMLRAAGVEVVTGVMENEALELNRFFMTVYKKHRPYIILKWAQSEDGFIDRIRKDQTEAPVLLSTPVTRLMVHKLRSEVQAIMVGTNTAILDNPSLTVRYWAGHSPLRVTIDRNQRIPKSAHLLDGKHPTLVYGEPGDNSIHFLRNIMEELCKRNIQSLLVEGGAQLHRSFLEAGLWDEIIVETSPVRLGTGVPAADLTYTSEMQLSEVKHVPFYSPCHKKTSLIEVYTHR
ncbi:MAG: bifunctional diaminohydroxyphosphoribosylaminopyrimidine deaminase/5-amino-6-(5-phosphoribosylamino)uracil reductase RibD [Tannerella sp.]|jgi:diaminohydroxyphosphoribosylaminopyrimidine deaminase/5-amino-6-(5-phosphoribosylamino)uracil reductase|nr:bifunctional diaminohydroxyphosphoribosylaminopyrimidine deaminase/5-amino-6-(5-phosphoribosylamino)uracil reductase RibD [Tannerella sp.]